MQMQELKVGSRTLDHMLRSGRFALIGGGFPSTLSAPEPVRTTIEDDSGSPLPLAISPVAEAFPTTQTWPLDTSSPRSRGESHCLM